MGTTEDTESNQLRRLRIILLALISATIIGTTIELVLLEHTESKIQWIPFGAFAVALAGVALVSLSTSPLAVRGFRLIMTAVALTGLAGLYFHFRGNVEFALETYPEMRGMELIKEAVMGATPTLAPGAMVQLGLLGLAYTYKHPALRRRADLN